MGIWQVIGLMLLAWLAWDVYSGKTWLHREIIRSEEPVKYWLGMGIWGIVALSVFVG